jgi:hypothetical protein
MALILSPADEFQFEIIAIDHMRVCIQDPQALEGLLRRDNYAHPKGSAVLQVFFVLLH